MPSSRFSIRLPRHLAGECASGCVFVERLSPPGQRVETELVDISRFGARIRLDQPLVVGDPLRLTIRDASNFEVALTGSIRWRQLDEDGHWSLGCLFDEQISWETFGELFLRNFIAVDEIPVSPKQVFDLSPGR